ncbi:single-stranded DNA-binding protein [Veillonellaceae bacterium M2-8]|nr:single-stranded DNA-binding protein [Veillonellaceae bacterium M2-8]
MNQIIVTGNAGKDAETRTTQTGKQMTSFSLAIYNGVNKQTNEPNAPTWLRVIAFDNLQATKVAKGTKILVIGKLKGNTWTDGQGQKHEKIEIWASEVYLTTKQGNTGFVENGVETTTEDIPF